MKPKDIPENSFVAVISDLLHCGFCYGHVKHYKNFDGDYSYSTISVSPTCAFRFTSTARIEVEGPNDMKLEYSIYV